MKSVMVIGGGPAGLSAAIALRQSGIAVSLYEQRTAWTGRVCGAFLSPDARGSLERLGVWSALLTRGAGANHASLVSPDGRKHLVALDWSGGGGLVVSRKDLEDVLTARAQSLGVELHWGTRVTELETRNGLWRAQVREGMAENSIEAPAVVCADGRFSSFRQKKAETLAHGWLGWNAEFSGVGYRPGELTLHFFPGGYVGTSTFPNGVTNICGLVHSSVKNGFGTWDDLWPSIAKKCPELSKAVEGARQISAFKGVPTLPFGRHARVEAGLFQAGDAAAVCDPFMGEGMARAVGAGTLIGSILSDCLFSPEALGQASNFYAREWDQRYSARSRMARGLRWMVRSPAVLSMFLKVWSRSSLLQNLLLTRIHS